MTDPLSAVGSVVGIVTLGLQLCKGLISYIDCVKTAKEKAEQITAEVDRLTDVLELLETVIGKADAGPIVTVTRTGVFACAVAIEKIKERLGNANHSKGRGTRAYLRDVKEKLRFPLRQADILYWKTVLLEVQQSLQTAIQVLQL